MRSLLLSILISIILTFIVTENYIISHMTVTGTPGNYTVSVFGGEFSYK